MGINDERRSLAPSVMSIAIETQTECKVAVDGITQTDEKPAPPPLIKKEISTQTLQVHFEDEKSEQAS